MNLHPDSQAPNTSATSPATEGPGITAEMNAEIDAAMKQMEAMDAAAKHQREEAAKAAPAAAPVGGRPAGIRGPRVVQAGREHRTGKVVTVGPTDIFVEFGPKELGIVPRIQFPEDQMPQKDQQLEVVIDKFEASEGIFLCSRPGSVQKADWEMLEVGQVIEARVTGVVSGKDGKQAGLELEVAGHRAFMPAGQVGERVPDLSIYVGEKMKAAVSRVERMGKGNIVLSRRDIIDAERQQNAEKLKGSLAEGQTVEGVVRKIMEFGAFVDIGGVDGLVHISDLTYDRIGFGQKAVAKYLKEGQKVTVRILKLDWENNRISLGMKQTQSDPFATAVNAITEGAEVTGKVTKIMEFGAFVELGPGVEGLVHISELDHRRVGNVNEVVKADEIVRCKVLKIDPQNRRISLSMKALKPLPELSIGGGGGGPGGGKKGKKEPMGRSAEEILKETPALRRLREQNRQMKFKGGIA
ncbi:MAG TPA: S1 RNA-binding domain-containing protein [Phycisphaerales bacterium]|nr:S1 RNA-binding domain-containing protein [Phycisphaerales bacterium]